MDDTEPSFIETKPRPPASTRSAPVPDPHSSRTSTAELRGRMSSISTGIAAAAIGRGCCRDRPARAPARAPVRSPVAAAIRARGTYPRRSCQRWPIPAVRASGGQRRAGAVRAGGTRRSGARLARGAMLSTPSEMSHGMDGESLPKCSTRPGRPTRRQHRARTAGGLRDEPGPLDCGICREVLFALRRASPRSRPFPQLKIVVWQFDSAPRHSSRRAKSGPSGTQSRGRKPAPCAVA
jgi:hypothetical protein